MKRCLFACLLLAWGPFAWGEAPGFYQEVDSVVWVVRDLDAVMNGWAGLGFGDQMRLGEVTMPQVNYRGRLEEVRFLAGLGYLGGFRVVWVQPLGPRSLYEEFLDSQGEGVMSLNHRVPSVGALQAEVERLQRLGVEVVQSGALPIPAGVLTYVYLDTYRAGKIRLCLFHSDVPPAREPSTVPLGVTDEQFAFVVRDLSGPSDFWERVGLPKMAVTHGALGDLVHRGQPGHFDQELGWQRHGKVTYEWIRPLQGPTVYEEFLAAHGEGFHHFAFGVADMDQAIAYFEAKGLTCSQSGSWGEKGQSGSGRFAYIDTESLGGVTIELLWNFQ